MQYIYHPDSSHDMLSITDETYRYLFKVRRHKMNDEFYFRNLNDDRLYKYIVKDIRKKEATFVLVSSETKIIEPLKKLHIAWCVIDTKLVEKYITSLNEMGVSEITFVYSGYSQKNFKPNLDKLNKILINSSQQCGRSSLMQLNICESLEEFIHEHPETKILDFSENKLCDNETIETMLIGTEGGFSAQERELFNKDNVIGLNSSLILRSETAAMSIAAKILL